VGIALAIGMLVDNSVVVLENIYRLAGTGKNPETAVKQGTTEVWRLFLHQRSQPLLFSSLSLYNQLHCQDAREEYICINSFNSPGLACRCNAFYPMATNFLLSRKSAGNAEIFKKLSIHDRLIQAYHLVLKASMKKPATTIIGTLVVFFAALLISLTISITSSGR